MARDYDWANVLQRALAELAPRNQLIRPPHHAAPPRGCAHARMGGALCTLGLVCAQQWLEQRPQVRPAEADDSRTRCLRCGQPSRAPHRSGAFGAGSTAGFWAHHCRHQAIDVAELSPRPVGSCSSPSTARWGGPWCGRGRSCLLRTLRPRLCPGCRACNTPHRVHRLQRTRRHRHCGPHVRPATAFSCDASKVLQVRT